MAKTVLLSAPNWCFLKNGMEPAGYYRQLKAIGYDAVEMAPADHYAEIRKQGLGILNTEGPGFEHGINRRENHATLIPETQERLRKAGANGVKHLILFSGNREGQDDMTGFACCRDAVDKILPVAEREGVTLIFEMLGANDHPGFHADNTAFGVALARAFNAPRFKLLYDIYHMFRMGENVLFDVIGNLDLIAHLHIAGSPKRDFPAEGQEIDYAALVPALAKAGYAGHWGMEFIPAGDSLVELEQAAALWRKYLG